MSISVEMTRAAGVTLATDGKFCEENIQVTPKMQEKTVSPAASEQQVTADSGNVGLSKVTVQAMPAAQQGTPGITVSAGGLITAEVTQGAGYVAGGTKSATKQLETQGAKTVTPSAAEQTAVSSGKFLTGAIKVQGDSNLISENIKEGVSIFGVAGSHAGGGGASSVLDFRTLPDLIPSSVAADGTVYNGTGFKSGYRLNSSAGETAESNRYVSGFIEIDPEKNNLILFTGNITIEYLMTFTSDFKLRHSIQHYSMQSYQKTGDVFFCINSYLMTVGQTYGSNPVKYFRFSTYGALPQVKVIALEPGMYTV